MMKEEKKFQGAIKKGEQRNPNGRPKGSKNKTTIQSRTFLQELCEEQKNKFRTELMTLEGKDFVDAYIKVIGYLVPKPRTEDEKVIDTYRTELLERLGK